MSDISKWKQHYFIEDQSDAVNMLLSINRFLNLDVSKPHNLFDWSSLWFTSDNIKLLDWIFEFQTGKANEDHYAWINESIIVAKHLYTSNQNNFMKNFSLSTEYQFLVMLTNSLFGNINCLGFWVDHILNGNKSLLWTLLWNYSIPEEQTWDNAILKSKEFKKRLIKNYYNFVKVWVEKTLGSRIAEYLHKFEIDKMLYMLLFGKLHNKDLIYEEMSNFTFLDSDVLEIFKSILTEETIPDLSLLIKKWLPFIMKNKQPLFSLNELLIKIDYFKGSDNMIPSGTMAQSLIVLKNKFKDQINERLLNDKYGFVIANNWIILDSAKLIKLILQCSTKNQDIIQDFIQMMLPLFENIPEAEDLLLILFQLSNLDYTRIFTVIPVIIKLMFR